MSQKINYARRKFLKFGLIVGVASTVKEVFAVKNLPPRNRVISVRFWPSKVYTRLTIEAKYNIKAKWFNLENPRRFVIDILNADLNQVVKDLVHYNLDNDPIVNGLKVGQFDPNTVRIVLYTKKPVLAQTTTLKPVNLGTVHYKYRYIFDMYNKGTQLKNTQLDDQLIAFLQLQSEDSNKPSLSHKKPHLKVKKTLIMIDPGHGGEDPGAIGHDGTYEKHIVLDIAKKLYHMINDDGELEAKLTRAQDIFIPLNTRVAIARKANADIFVSVHADSFSSRQVHGSSVFVLSEDGASSAFAKYLAQSQNQSDLIGGISFKTRDKLVNKILLDMTQSFTLKKSTSLGSNVLTSLGQVNHLHSHKVERAGFAVLKAPDIPSILVESAFLSNLKEETLLRKASFREEIARQIYLGIKKYQQSKA